jgi:outer membrane immunogenic protein
MRIRLTGAAAAMALTATAATAAEVYGGPPPYGAAPAPYYTAFSWMGPYVGGNLGYQWGALSNSGANPSGLSGGGEAGFNWQAGQFVFGAETDLEFSGASDTFANYKFSNPWFGTVRGRAGYALNNILFYGTLGLAYGRGQVTLAGLTESNLHTGLAAGVGLEVGLTQNWSAKAEYLYIDFGSETYGLIGTSNALTSSVARLGLNYHF